MKDSRLDALKEAKRVLEFGAPLKSDGNTMMFAGPRQYGLLFPLTNE